MFCDGMWNELRFYYYHGYKLDLKNPRTFLEKLQWQKYFGKIEQYEHIFAMSEYRYVLPNLLFEKLLHF
jgi:hypothetical protein